MEDLKSFKKYSWIISGIFAVLVFVSGLTINDVSFLPPRYQEIAVGIIGASALIIKLIPENMRVERAENIVHNEYNETNESMEAENE